jgi:imidazolonepropionase-like amidohydrolase
VLKVLGAKGAKVLRVLAAPFALVALLAPAPIAPARTWSTVAPTLSLFLLGHRVGTEQYTLTPDSLTSHFEYLDRATTVSLDTTLTFKTDFTPLSFESHGRTYRLFPVDASVPKASGAANTFTLEGMAPIAAQGLLIQYWLAHGRPAAITLEPSGDVIRIADKGGGMGPGGVADRGLRHFTIDGVVWGREDVWLDASDMHVAMAFTTAGVMSFEAYEPKFTALAGSWRRVITPMSFVGVESAQRDVTPRASRTFALTGGRVIDGTGAAPIEDAVVLVRNNRIARVGPRASTPIPPGTPRVDVTGKTVLPGLWDMHAHVGQPEWGPIYLASGVTTIREMGGEFDVVTSLRDAWQREPAPPPAGPIRDVLPPARLIGPRLLLAGLVDGPGPGSFGHVTAASPDEGRQVVARYKAAGFQQMKLYSLLDRPTVSAILGAAHRSGMTVTGHVPNGLTMREVIEMGLDHVAHLGVRDAPGSEAMRDTIAFLKAHGTVVDPTLSWNELLGRSAQTSIASFIPRIEHVAPPLRRMLDAANGGNVTPAQARERLARSLQIVKALHDAGVPIVPGTDKGVPGVSLARELELYVDAGISPMDAIRAATGIPARLMRLERETGTLIPGLSADLIVVDGNPLVRIADIEKVELVCARGTLYESASLWSAGGFVR